MKQEDVRREIEKNTGTQFDADIAKCMLKIIDEDKDYELHENSFETDGNGGHGGRWNNTKY